MIIKIKNLALRTIIGFKDWEREKKQDILINLEIETEVEKGIVTDSVDDSVDYKTITKKIINEVGKTNFNLLEKLTGFILDLVMEDRKIKKATVEVDKPHALRFSESVSVKLTRER
jgi:D-erythro-7,8-dihydroneopterin triphosphate epimerase